MERCEMVKIYGMERNMRDADSPPPCFRHIKSIKSAVKRDERMDGMRAEDSDMPNIL